MRFKVVDIDDVKKYKDPSGLVHEDYFDEEFVNYLVDIRTGKVVFCDSTEPEDATLTRTFWPLVDLLNKVASE